MKLSAWSLLQIYHFSIVPTDTLDLQKRKTQEKISWNTQAEICHSVPFETQSTEELSALFNMCVIGVVLK